MGEVRDRVFELGSESISDGLPFFQLGYIKGDTHEGLRIVCQNRKVIDPIAKKAVGITPFPKLSLFKIDTNFASNFWNSFSGSNIRELEGINFVDDLVIKKVEGTSLSDALNGAFMAFIAPHDFADDNVKKDGTRNYYYDEIKGTATFAENNGQK
ncbi:6118_t:CDS:2 [Entrophospora sp. SA101]|nr:6118_t:CDS:2 [Entrophospora sp. SA101]